MLELPIPWEPANRISPLRDSGIQFLGTRIIPLKESGLYYETEYGASG